MPAPRPGAILRAATALVAAALPAAVLGAADPIPFESPSGLVIVHARVDGGHDLRILLDTGDPGGLTLHESAARALGLASGPSRPGTARGLGGGARVGRRPALLRELAIGGTTWRDLAIDVVPANLAFAAGVGAELDGCMGTALIADLRVSLDYAARTLRLDRGAGRDLDAGRGTPLRLSGGRLLTTVNLAGVPAVALIDTGSAVTFVDGAVVDGAVVGGAMGSTSAATPPDEVRVVDANGHVETLATVRVAGLAAGGAPAAEFAAVPADLARRLAGFLPPGAPTPTVVLGADLLSRHRVILDLAAGIFIMDRGRP
jgi:hypothetical protein